MNKTLIQGILEFLKNEYKVYFTFIGQHLFISLLALGISTIIGFFIGFIFYKNKYLRSLTMNFSNILRLVPSLAMLFLLVPILGVGFKPALVALVILGIPPVLINTVTGLAQVDNSYIEVAKAMGMDEGQVNSKIILPLARGQILSGIKISLVEIISSATLAAYIGADGLGVLIFTGLQMLRMDWVIVGAITVALMTFVITLIFDLLINRVNYPQGGNYE